MISENNIVEQVKALEAFVYDNEDFEQLENIVDQFNIFNALGIVNKEVRHSNFLAWLFDPNGTHGLGNYPARLFLKEVTSLDNQSRSNVSIIDIDTWALDELQVLTEWKRIDLLLVDDAHKFICIIENKIDSKEHSNQLTRYKEIVELEYPEHKKVFIYLTVTGEEAEKERSYIPISYNTIADIIVQLKTRKESQMNDEVAMFINHYHHMLTRYIMEESQVQELCTRLYKKHKTALDLIYQYKPDIHSDIEDAIEAFIDSKPELIKDHCTKQFARFIPEELDFIPKVCTGWTPSRRIVLFEATSNSKIAQLTYYLGPGDVNTREMVFNHVKDNKDFNGVWGKLSPKWAMLYKHQLVKISELEGKTKEEINDIIYQKMDSFFDKEYPKIKKSILELKSTFS